jgi:hypothetical protein
MTSQSNAAAPSADCGFAMLNQATNYRAACSATVIYRFEDDEFAEWKAQSLKSEI